MLRSFQFEIIKNNINFI